ncbi:MAG: group 1 truncated hemoglobin [Polyangiaceae bacterium]|nr:group 1 truncated hemoglobin [Polyangiaceae bacterium]
MRARLLVSSILIASCAFAFACGGEKPPPPAAPVTVVDAGPEDAATEPPPPKSLYDRIGGKDAVSKIVDSFLKNLESNAVTKKHFVKLSKDRKEKFRQEVADQLCQLTGGDCHYNGKDMKAAHKGMRITEAEWNATIAALKAAMDENAVGDAETSDLMALLAPMKDDIVEVKAKPKTR